MHREVQRVGERQRRVEIACGVLTSARAQKKGENIGDRTYHLRTWQKWLTASMAAHVCAALMSARAGFLTARGIMWAGTPGGQEE